MPEIGIPQLRAFLAAHGVSSRQLDLNHEFIRNTFPRLCRSPGVIREAVEKSLVPTDCDLDAFFRTLQIPNPVYDAFIQEALVPRFLDEAPRVVGISLLDTPQFYPSCLIVRALKRLCPSVFTVLGGPWVTAARDLLPEILERLPELDGCICHSGERPLLELVQALRGGVDLSDVSNLTWRSEGGIVANDLATPVPLDAIPTPDFSDVNLNEYAAPVLTVATQRGCYWGQCVFCHHTMDHPWGSQSSVEHVVDSMLRLSRQHGTSHFFLADTATHPELMGQLARRLLETGARIRWSCMTRVESCYDPDFCRLLADSGCHTILFGLESTSEEVLRRVRKGIQVEVLDSILTNLKAVGIWVDLFVVDIPSFPFAAVKETIEWLLARKDRFVHVFLRRLIVARASLIWENPGEIDIRIAPGAERSLDVFNLPYEYDGQDETRPLKELKDRFIRSVDVPELRQKRRTNTWVLTGQD